MKKIIELSVKHPLSTIMVFLGTVIIGLSLISGMGMDFMPEIKNTSLTVQALWPSLPAKEVRSMITLPLEESFSSIKGVKKIVSYSKDSVSSISMSFTWDTDMKLAAVEIREAIDSVYPCLPEGCKKPSVLSVNPNEEPLMIIALIPKNNDMVFAKRIAEREVKTLLLQADGVGALSIVGGLDEEIKITADQKKLSARGLTIDDLAQVISRTNYEYPAGTIIEDDKEFIVKTNGRVNGIDDLKEFYIKSDDKNQFVLSDVADLNYAFKEPTSFFELNGKKCIGITVKKRSGASPVETAASVNKEIENIRKSYKKDFELIVVKDASIYIREAIIDLVLSTILGAGIAFVVLLLFMRDFGTALIMITSVPFSIVVSLLFLRLFGRTVNAMTLGGLAMGIGMMVDNSVVVLDNLQRRIVISKEKISADKVIEYTHELSGSNIGATVVSIIVFLPVMFIPGVTGAMFTDLALSVIFSQIASFIIAITLVPVLFLMLKNYIKPKAIKSNKSSGILYERIERKYKKVFVFFIKKPVFLFSILFFLIVLGIASFAVLNIEFLSKTDIGEVNISLIQKDGTSIKKSEKTAALLNSIISEVKEVKYAITRVGGEISDLYYQADPEDKKEIIHIKAILTNDRQKNAFVIAVEIMSKLKASGISAEVAIPISSIETMLGIKDDFLRFVVYGKDHDEAQIKAEAIISLDPKYTDSSDVLIYPDSRKSLIYLEPDRESIANSGLDLALISETVRTSIDGTYPTQLLINGKEVDVKIVSTESIGKNIELIDKIPIKTNNVQSAPLVNFAKYSEKLESSCLLRVDRQDAKIIQSKSSSNKRIIEKNLLNQAAALGIEIKPYKKSAIEENASAIGMIFILVVILMYLALGAQFESFTLPLLLLSTLPLGALGIFIGLFITGNTINLNSLLGIIVLFGVAVNNGIILYETYSNRSSNDKKGILFISIYRGTIDRFKPILITVITTILSMLPLALDFSHKSSQSAMAISVIFGLIVSTVMTLFIMPLLIYKFKGRK